MSEIFANRDLLMLEAVASVTVAVVICAALAFNVVVLLRIWRMLDDLGNRLSSPSPKLAENLRGLRSAAPGAASSDADRDARDRPRLQRLEAQLEQNDQVVQQLRKRLVEAEARAVEQSRLAESAWKESLRDAEASNQKLKARAAQLEATLQRVDREKQLVEQKYLQLDARLGAP